MRRRDPLVYVTLGVATLALLLAIVGYTAVLINFSSDQARTNRVVARIADQERHHCESINHLNAVTRDALEEAKKRARASLPPGDPRLENAVRVIDSQIRRLVDDPSCETT